MKNVEGRGESNDNKGLKSDDHLGESGNAGEDEHLAD